MSETLAALLEEFAGTGDAALWAAYPDLDDAGQDRSDEVACEQMSARFVRRAREAGLDATLVVGTDADEPLVEEHWWAQVEGLNVDWTARQFHNLEHPANPAHADLPCPLLWRGDEHPVVSFRTRTVRELSAASAAA